MGWGRKIKSKYKLVSPSLGIVRKSHKDLKKECDRLWAECVKARAGYRSEISKLNTEVLAAHHIAGKGCYRLRYELENGICLLNNKEHIHGVHSSDPLKAEIYRSRILKVRGEDIFERMNALKQSKEKTDLKMVEIWLRSVLRGLKGK